MKIAALDIGDVWTGSAIADALGISCKPYKTVQTTHLISFLKELIMQHTISTIVVGDPTTLRGTQSQQTHKVYEIVEELKKLFPNIEWKLWDERLSSKRASSLRSSRPLSSQEKQHQHSIAAAFILQNYLDHKAFKASFLDN